MQTRKRAKSITFGKKKAEEEKDEEVLSAAPPVVEAPKPIVQPSETTVEKAETVERRTVAEKPAVSELSNTLPKSEEEDDKPETPLVQEVATPATEFITDDKPSEAPEKGKPDVSEPEPSVESPEPQLEATLSPEQPAPTATSEELSPTSGSAFTIQNDEKEHAPEVVGDGKKRFGIYFFLVAFLAFILGLGAMAAVSYGWINIPMLKVPSNIKDIKVPAIPGLKATPTTVPTIVPTAVPTAKPVDLSAFTITVLNGSGIVGKASEVKTSLTTAGFKVASTGNADKNTYTKTEIAAKKSVNKDYLTKLEDELKKSYDVDTVSTAPESDTSDVTVTIGQSKAK
ncbi:MAG: LytR C-terminal domain-containing protein [Candidatus Levyibacteriota bacterium]